jgi:hypothetical protein
LQHEVEGGRKVMSEKKKCGCNRSPTGYCVGWHALSEEEYKEKKAAFEAKQVDKARE